MEIKQAKVELTNLNNPKSKVIAQLTKEAISKGYYGVCVLANCIGIADRVRKSSNADIKIITVAGFPPVRAYGKMANPTYQLVLGHYTKKELALVKDICNNPNVDELDLVFPMFLYYRGRKKRIEWLLRGIKQRFNKPVKVIIELGTIFKKEENLKEICAILKRAGVDIVKTNTGLIKQDFEDLADHLQTLIKCTRLPIKASGGIRTVKQAEVLSALGVARIGTSCLQGAING
jgi:deoxyribose-phosphate aldolase